MIRRCLVVLGILAAYPSLVSAAVPETVLGTVIDFAASTPGSFQGGFLDSWRWTDEFREQSRPASRLEIVADRASGKSALHIQVTSPTIFAHGALPLLRLAPFYPPEADVLRVHVRGTSGKLRMFAGGPTAYYANSDVYTQTLELDTDAEPQQRVLDFSLNHPLRRNFRRAGFSTDAKRNYYNRWAQEPLHVFIAPGTTGDFLIERIEVVARGEGRPFPEFAAEQVRTVRKVADFDDAATAPSPFTLYMAANEVEWFEQSWLREKPLRFEPPRFEVVDDAERKSRVLCALGRFAEEVHCAGLITEPAAQANAIRLAVRHQAAEYRNTVVGQGRAEAIDFLVFVSEPKRPLAWQAFAADEALRKHAGPGFDAQLSYLAVRKRDDLDFAIYHTRRYLRPEQWTTLVLPAADFVCVYGSGRERERFLHRRPLTCDNITAVAWLSPWCRAGRGNTPVEIRVDDVDLVQVGGTVPELRSFWQVDDATVLDWRDETGPPGRERIMLLPGDKW